MAMRYNNNDQAMGSQNINISGVAKYATADYGSSWATTAAITASLLALFPDPVNGDLAILRNTNGTDESRFYFRSAGAWENIGTTTVGAGAVTATELAADAVETAKILNANVTAAKLATDAVETAKIKNSNVTTAKLSTAAATRVMPIIVPALAAGVDITLTVAIVPTGCVMNVVSAAIIPSGTSAGIDDSNKSTWALTDGTNTLVTKEFDSSPAFPSAGTNTDLGTISTDYDNIAAGSPLKIVVTNGTTAATPATTLNVVYNFTDA